MEAILFKTNGEVLEITPQNGTDFQLNELYKILECDTIEVIKLQQNWEKPDDLIMIGDEEARLLASPMVNVPISAFYQTVWLSGVDPKVALKDIMDHIGMYESITHDEDPDDPYNIVGNIIVCKSKMLK